MARQKLPVVFFVSPLFNATERGVLRGLSEHAMRHGRWTLAWGHAQTTEAPQMFRTWRPRGLVGLGNPTPALRRWLLRHGIAYAYFGYPAPRSTTPCVVPDNLEIGRVGARHLLERGFRQFAYFGSYFHTIRKRQDGFVEELGKHGMRCQIFESARIDITTCSFQYRRDEVTGWLRRLTPPVGIMAVADSTAWYVNLIAPQVGLRVPEDVAVLGVGDDDLLCTSTMPTLSSVYLDHHSMGLELGAIMDRLLRGRAVSPRVRVLAPAGVTARASTDVVVYRDPIVANALHLMRQTNRTQITVKQIIQEIGQSRRAFERRFRRVVGVSPAVELRRLRIEQVKAMLTQTDIKISVVARTFGYRRPHDLWRAFRHATGISPLAYRQHDAAGPKSLAAK